MVVVKVIFNALLLTVLIKLAGLLREIFILRYVGITEEASKILMLNVIPSIITGFIKYATINYALSARRMSVNAKEEVNNSIGVLIFRTFIMLLPLTIFYMACDGITSSIIFFIYYLVGYIYIVIGYKEFNALGTEHVTHTAKAAIIATITSIAIVIIFSPLIHVYTLPLATFCGAIINYILISKLDNGLEIKYFYKYIKGKIEKKYLLLIFPIVAIEATGSLFGVVDYFYIKYGSETLVEFQLNYYAQMLYNLPVSIIGLVFGAIASKDEHVVYIIKYIKSNFIAVFLLYFMALVFLYKLSSANIFSEMLNIFLIEMIPNVKQVLSIVDLFKYYFFGIFSASLVFIVTKILLTYKSSDKICFIYSMALLIKIIFMTVISVFSEFNVNFLAISTITSWMLLSFILLFIIKFGRYDVF